MVTTRIISAPTTRRTEDERMIMRLKEGKSFSSRESGEFYSRDKTNGLEISGISLKSTEGKGEIIAVVRQNKGSNNHLLLVSNSDSAAVASSTADQLPLSYVEYFNRHSPPNTPSLQELSEASVPALSQAIASLPEGIPQQFAFAHIVPTPGHMVNATLALSDGMVAILTNIASGQKDGETRVNIISKKKFSSAIDMPGIATGMMSFPRGTKVLLATSMDALASTQPLETVSEVYNSSRQLLTATQAESIEALGRLMPQFQIHGLRDDVLNALSSICVLPQYQPLLKEQDDMGLAAMIIRNLISQSIKEERYGNFILPERVAVIASRVPTLRRRKAHET